MASTFRPRHYRILAGLIATSTDKADFTNKLIAALQFDNPKFSEDMFRKAANLKDNKSGEI